MKKDWWTNHQRALALVRVCRWLLRAYANISLSRLRVFGWVLRISHSCWLQIQTWTCPHDKNLSGFQILVWSVACLNCIWRIALSVYPLGDGWDWTICYVKVSLFQNWAWCGHMLFANWERLTLDSCMELIPSLWVLVQILSNVIDFLQTLKL